MELIQNNHIKLSTQGAHLYHWKPIHCSKNVLFCSKKVVFESGKAIRGGIPICWPWFGPKQGNPQHGFARTLDWHVINYVTDEKACNITLQLQSNTQTWAWWPYEFNLLLNISASDHLELTLTTHNLDNQAFEFSSALHTYFEVGDISRTNIYGLDDIDFVDKVDEGKLKNKSGDIKIEGEVDRVYLSAKMVSLHDVANNRNLQISSEGSNSIVVWNPWKEKAAQILDMDDDEYKKFVCIENACTHPVMTLMPGGRHILRAKIEVLNLIKSLDD